MRLAIKCANKKARVPEVDKEGRDAAACRAGEAWDGGTDLRDHSEAHRHLHMVIAGYQQDLLVISGLQPPWETADSGKN